MRAYVIEALQYPFKNPENKALLPFLDDIIEIAIDVRLDGLIATNTTIHREGLSTSESKINEMGDGGLSGQAIRARSTEVIKYLADRSKGRFPIIGVGGINTAEDAIEKLRAGATLLQVYTGFVYEGPAMLKKINKGISDWRKESKLLERQKIH